MAFLIPEEKKNSLLTWQELYLGLLMPSLQAASTSKMVSGFEEEIRSLMALSPGRKAITHSNESTIVGNRLMKETEWFNGHNRLKDVSKRIQYGFDKETQYLQSLRFSWGKHSSFTIFSAHFLHAVNLPFNA